MGSSRQESPEELIMMSEDCNFAFKRLRMKHMPEVISIMRKSLYFTEPLMKIVDLKKNVMAAKQVDYLINEIASIGVSVVAIEVSTQKVVGAGISYLEKRGPKESTFFMKQQRLPNIFPAYGNLLEANRKMEEKTYMFDEINVNWLMMLQYFATHPSYYQQGIGKGILTACVELGKSLSTYQRGIVPLRDDVYPQLQAPQIDGIASILTTPISRHIARSLGWEELYSVYFGSWLYKGKTFSSILNDNNLKAICMAIRFPKQPEDTL